MRTDAGVGRGGFTLVEVLVTVSIIVVLVALFGGAISAGRSITQLDNTRKTVARLDQIISTQFRRYEAQRVSRNDLDRARQALAVSGTTPSASAARAWHIRRNLITADMPDRWTDVAYMASAAGAAEGFPRTAAQATYIATYRAINPSENFGGAECLFMIIMQGGVVDCLDCNGLAQVKKGDKDRDGALEFWDAWDNPIDYILWAPAYKRRGAMTPFFRTLDAAFSASGSVRPGLGMRPLIYSAGPDSARVDWPSVPPKRFRYGLNRDPNQPGTTADQATLTTNLGSQANPAGRDCGNPLLTSGTSFIGEPTPNEEDFADNIVNVEFKDQP